jgi:creatinine amidohydrolase
MVNLARVRTLDPIAMRAYIGDGNFGGAYQRSDDDMMALWKIAVDETRDLLVTGWGSDAP